MLKRSSRQTDFPLVKFADINFVEIFPPIGVARLGDSAQEYFLDPELPIDNDTRGNILPTADNKFRDGEGNIRRQAARFRVYAYDKNNKILGEVNVHNGYTLTWEVLVVNMKAAGNNIRSAGKRNPDVQNDRDPHERTDLIVNPGKKTITRKNGDEVVQLEGKFKGKLETAIDVDLGQLQVDDAGRLVFLGAKGGIFGTMPSDIKSLDNLNCVDDACDGWVDVIIKYSDSETKQARHKAAVLSGPPKFAWDLRSTTSIFDLIEDVYQGAAPVEKPEFNVDIWPVLEAASLMSWVDNSPNRGHGSSSENDFLSCRQKLQGKAREDQEYKRKIFTSLKNPSGGGGTMPKLEDGSGSSALTKLQYKRFELWKEHKFNVTPLNVVAQLENLALEEQTKCLTRANLEMTIGGTFEPGIEASEIVKERTTYDTEITDLDPPYRVKFSDSNVRPGDLTVALALPWQSDFEHCRDSWWPVARPVDVLKTSTSTTRDRWARGAEGTDGLIMLTKWHRLGFVIKPFTSANTRVENERKLA